MCYQTLRITKFLFSLNNVLRKYLKALRSLKNTSKDIVKHIISSVSGQGWKSRDIDALRTVRFLYDYD